MKVQTSGLELGVFFQRYLFSKKGSYTGAKAKKEGHGINVTL